MTKKLSYSIAELQEAVSSRRYVITEHAREEAENDALLFEDVKESLMKGEIIEEYPHDRPFPSCLVFGKTRRGEPVHSVWAYDLDAQIAILITVYRPDPRKWIDWKIRKKKGKK